MSTSERAYWPADTSREVLDVTVGRLLQEAAAEAPDTAALVSVAPGRPARTWTYGELLDDAERAAAWLLQRFSTGEHVAVWAPNVPEWIVLQYGAALAGLVLVTANPALRGDELEHLLRASHSVGVFHVGELRGTDMSALLEEVLPSVPDVREKVDFAGWLDDVRSTEPTELPEVDPGSATQIQFTSGTTGRPKAAVLGHAAMVTNAADVRERCESTFGATFATGLPLFHTAGCGLAGMGSVHERASLVLAEVFDPEVLLSAVESYGAKILGGVPAMLYALLQHPRRAEFDLTSVEVIMSGGDLVPPPLADAWRDACGAAASAVYGQTELSPIACQTRPSDSREDNLFTAGQPMPNLEVAILDVEDASVRSTGAEGEICVRGYSRMIEYLDMPEATAETIDAEGWLHTGDLGQMDARGYVTVTGRLKDMIIRGGENIYPRELEEVLVQHPAVADAAVVGLSDPSWGERVVAVIKPAPGPDQPTIGGLHEYLRDRLAPHKTPKSWYAADEFPTNAMGKLQKFRLREQILSGELVALSEDGVSG